MEMPEGINQKMKFMSVGGFKKRNADRGENINEQRLLGSPYKEHNLSGLKLIKNYCREAWDDLDFGREERDFYNDSTKGFNLEGHAEDIISVSCDPVYFNRFGGAFVSSCFEFNPDVHVHLHLTLPNDETVNKLEQTALAYGSSFFSYSYNNSAIHQSLLYSGVFLTCARFIHSHSVISRNSGRCVNLDIDSIFRSRLGGFINDKIDGRDIAFIRRFERIKPSRKVLASALINSGSGYGIRFSDALSRALVKILLEGPQYHIDQTTLYYLISYATKDGLHACTMGADLADHRFRESSPVWSAKGRSRKKDPRFLSISSTAQENFVDVLKRGSP